MAGERTLAARQRARESWHELDEPPRRALQLSRPHQWDMFALRGRVSTATDILNLVSDHVIGWRGFKNSDLLGAVLGSDDPEPFDAVLMRDWMLDEVEIVQEVGGKLIDAVREATDKRQAEAKNSATS